METYQKDSQYLKFCLYGFLKNLRFYDAFLLLFFLENEITFSQIGILYASREIITNIVEIPSGIFADTFGRKSSLLAAFCLYIISFVTFYFSLNFNFLLIAMLFIGIGDAFRTGTHKGMIMDYLRMNKWEKHKVAYYGSTRAWSQKGSAISALLAGIMVFYSGGYRIIYLISTLPYLLNFINIYSYPDELNYSLKKNKKRLISMKDIFKNFIASLKNNRVLEVVNSAALHSAFLKSIKDYIQPLIINIAIFLPFFATMETKRKSGLIIGITYFFIFLLTSQASQYSSKLLSFAIKNIAKKTLLLGLFLGIICGVLFHFKLWMLSLVFFVLIYIIENIRKPILIGLLTDDVPNEILTSVISAQSSYQTFVTSTLALLIGILADHYGIGISLVFVSMLLFLLTLLIENKRLEKQ